MNYHTMIERREKVKNFLKIIIPDNFNSLLMGPVIVVKNKKVSAKMCVDFCLLNKVTNKKSYSASLIDETFGEIYRNKKYFQRFNPVWCRKR